MVSFPDLHKRENWSRSQTYIKRENLGIRLVSISFISIIDKPPLLTLEATDHVAVEHKPHPIAEPITDPTVLSTLVIDTLTRYQSHKGCRVPLDSCVPCGVIDHNIQRILQVLNTSTTPLLESPQERPGMLQVLRDEGIGRSISTETDEGASLPGPQSSNTDVEPSTDVPPAELSRRRSKMLYSSIMHEQCTPEERDFMCSLGTFAQKDGTYDSGISVGQQSSRQPSVNEDFDEMWEVESLKHKRGSIPEENEEHVY